MNKGALWAIIGLLTYILFVMLINAALSPSHAANSLFPPRFEGRELEGHAENHMHYQGLQKPRQGLLLQRKRL